MLEKDFLDMLIIYLSDEIDEEQRFQYLWDLSLLIAENKKLQSILTDYINNGVFTRHQKWKIYSLLKEIYVCEECYEIEGHIYLENIYNWVLNTMFTKDFFDYSYCHQFSHLLNNIINDEEQVYGDIINQIDLDDLITVRIAICSTYGFEFYRYKNITEQFLDIILTSLEKNIDNENIIKDFQCFMVSCLDRLPYIRYKRLFRKYLR